MKQVAEISRGLAEKNEDAEILVKVADKNDKVTEKMKRVAEISGELAEKMRTRKYK